MADSTPLERGEIRARPEHIFPTLTPAQVARVAAHARRRPMQAGEVLLQEGSAVVPFFVVAAGRLDVIRISEHGEDLIANYRPGQFTLSSISTRIPTCRRCWIASM